MNLTLVMRFAAVAVVSASPLFAGGAQCAVIDQGFSVDPCYKQCSPMLAGQGRRAFRECMALCQRPSPQAAARCPSGLVWRERFDGDTICVLPGERDENRRLRGLATGQASACPSGLVWREGFDGDTVCVTPLERDANRRRRGLQ